MNPKAFYCSIVICFTFLAGCSTNNERVIVEDNFIEYRGIISNKVTVCREEVVDITTKQEMDDESRRAQQAYGTGIAIITIVAIAAANLGPSPNFSFYPEVGRYSMGKPSDTALKYTVDISEKMALEVYSNHTGFEVGDCVRIFKGKSGARMAYGSNCD